MFKIKSIVIITKQIKVHPPSLEMWNEYKKRKYEGYLEAKARGEVDEDIIPLLDLINSFEEFVTLSSCSGRIAVMDMPEFGDKVEAEFLGKWHRCVEYEEVLDAVRRGKKTTWLIMFPPIIHVACKDLASAERLMAIANNAGLRRNGIISLKNYVVEINTLERLEAPVAIDGEVIVDEKALRIMVKIANKKLEKSKKKLEKLYNLLSQLHG
jgi:tRNA wybutosine-synthesizing protein 3